VYKSEVCFAARVHPFRKVQTLTATELADLAAFARRYMQANIAAGSPGQIVTYTGLRRTTGSSDQAARLWVYRRRGLACRRCGTAIESRKQGLGARTSFWCPQCQPYETPAIRS
jgi:endonuclease-8